MKADELRKACREAVNGPKSWLASGEYTRLDDGDHQTERKALAKVCGLLLTVETTTDGLLIAWHGYRPFNLAREAGELCKALAPYERFTR